MIYFNYSIIILSFIEFSFFIIYQFILIIIFIIHLQILQFTIIIIFNNFIAKIILQIHSSNHFFHNIIFILLFFYNQLFNHEYLIINQIININAFHFLINYLFILQLNAFLYLHCLND